MKFYSLKLKAKARSITLLPKIIVSSIKSIYQITNQNLISTILKKYCLIINIDLAVVRGICKQKFLIWVRIYLIIHILTLLEVFIGNVLTRMSQYVVVISSILLDNLQVTFSDVPSLSSPYVRPKLRYTCSMGHAAWFSNGINKGICLGKLSEGRVGL